MRNRKERGMDEIRDMHGSQHIRREDDERAIKGAR